MTDRRRRRRLIHACAGAASLAIHKAQVRGVEKLLDRPSPRRVVHTLGRRWR